MANVFISIANCSSRHSASVGGAGGGRSSVYFAQKTHNTDPGRSGVCLTYLFTTRTRASVACVTIFLQHWPSPQWRVSHYLSTTRTQPAELLGKKMKKSVSLGKNLARNTTVGALNIMRDFSQFCTLLWVISYIFIRDAGAPLRPRTRPGNMRTFVVIVTCL